MNNTHITEKSPRKITIHGSWLANKKTLWPVVDICRKTGITDYVYRIYVSDRKVLDSKKKPVVDYTLKIGESGTGHPDTKRSIPGQRLYRQLSHLPNSSKIAGFPNGPRHKGNSGSEIRNTCRDFQKRYGMEISLDRVHIDIWDMKDVYDGVNPPDKLRKHYETQLSKAYQSCTGHYPVGNKENKDQTIVNPQVAQNQLTGLTQAPVWHKKKRDGKIQNNFNKVFHISHYE
jgi:hypothetical protein